MAFTYTRTCTVAYGVGEQLAQQHQLLSPAFERMNAFSKEYERTLQDNGVRLEPTNDATQFGLLRHQWREVLPLMSDSSSVTRHSKMHAEIQEISDLLPDNLE